MATIPSPSELALSKLALPRCRLLEGIVTTVNADGSTNISPMGPIVDEPFEWLRLRPYQTSTTFQNLERTGEGVLHVTDDVLLLAQAAVGVPEPLPRLTAATSVRAKVLADACRWYAFRVESLDRSAQRTDIVAQVVERGRLRDFFGFNRAKHAVVEAAILATRLEFIPADEILAEFDRLAIPVDKTGAEEERRAYAVLRKFVDERLTGERLREAAAS